MTDKEDRYYSRPGEQATSTFNVRIPEVYQVEITNACNFHCDFCPRDLPGIRRPDTFLDLRLARTIAERDLGGSYFVEFQLAGESTLHKQFNEIIAEFAGKVLTGVSTNGSSVHGCLPGLMMLDYLTVSIDSVSNYENVRKGGSWQRLLKNMDLLIEEMAKRQVTGERRPAIDLQLIEFPGVKQQRDDLETVCYRRGWKPYVTIRTIPDCRIGLTQPHHIRAAKKELCLNPWMSCTVQADGDVTSCCFAFGKETIYGNLNNQSLEEIWATSTELQKLREEHLTQQYRPLCASCYMRSPVNLHLDLYKNTVKDRVLIPIYGAKS